MHLYILQRLSQISAKNNYPESPEKCNMKLNEFYSILAKVWILYVYLFIRRQFITINTWSIFNLGKHCMEGNTWKGQYSQDPSKQHQGQIQSLKEEISLLKEKLSILQKKQDICNDITEEGYFFHENFKITESNNAFLPWVHNPQVNCVVGIWKICSHRIP